MGVRLLFLLRRGLVEGEDVGRRLELGDGYEADLLID
jgi:hypothetical protein